MNRLFSFLTAIFFMSSLIACGGSQPERGFTPRGGEEAAAPEKPAEPEKVAEESAAEGMIKINEVTAEEILSYKISGVGKAMAEAIVEYREANGPFRSMEDLDKVPRMGPTMMEKLQGRIDFGNLPADTSASSAAPSTTDPKAAPAKSSTTSGKVNINTGSLEDLMNLKGVGEATAQKIIDYRKAHGPYKSIDELDNVSGIGAAKINGFRDQVTL